VFTGLVESVGQVLTVEDVREARVLTIAALAFAQELTLGESIAIDGVCLTVTDRTDTHFRVQAVGPTLERTTVGEWRIGRKLNLERAVRADTRLGGHFVQGHIDGVGKVLRIARQGEHVLLDVQLPEIVAEVTVLHGSLAIDGVSLTVSALPADNSAQVALIPHTWANTNLPRLEVGDRVNLEGDLLGRYVVQYLKRMHPAPH
jgi:riboflavin synthase